MTSIEKIAIDSRRWVYEALEDYDAFGLATEDAYIPCRMIDVDWWMDLNTDYRAHATDEVFTDTEKKLFAFMYSLQEVGIRLLIAMEPAQ